MEKKNFREVIGPIFLKNIKSIVDNICSEGYLWILLNLFSGKVRFNFHHTS